MDRFAFTEGLSGSAFADVLRGDDADATPSPQAGCEGSVLTNIGLITGLQGILPGRPASPRSAAGNIILGRRRQRHHRRPRRRRHHRRRCLAERAHRDRRRSGHRPAGGHQRRQHEAIWSRTCSSGEINPGQLSIVREILTSPTAPTSIPRCSPGPRANYTVITAGSTARSRRGTDNVGTAGQRRHRHAAQHRTSAVLRRVDRPRPRHQPAAGRACSTHHRRRALGGPVADRHPQQGVDRCRQCLGEPISRPRRQLRLAVRVRPDRAPGVFRDIVDAGGNRRPPRDGAERSGSRRPSTDCALRVHARSTRTTTASSRTCSRPRRRRGRRASLRRRRLPVPAKRWSSSAGVRFIRSDLQFILDQIAIAERHAAGEDLLDLLPNSRVAFGSAHRRRVVQQPGARARPTSARPIHVFPRLLDPVFQDEQDEASVRHERPGAGRPRHQHQLRDARRTSSTPTRASFPT